MRLAVDVGQEFPHPFLPHGPGPDLGHGQLEVRGEHGVVGRHRGEGGRRLLVFVFVFFEEADVDDVEDVEEGVWYSAKADEKADESFCCLSVWAASAGVVADGPLEEEDSEAPRDDLDTGFPLDAEARSIPPVDTRLPLAPSLF